MSTRVLLVNLDSMDPSLTRQMVAEGELPTIATLLSQGEVLNIENLPGFGNGVFWPCINTGVDPSRHGCFYLAQPKPPEYSLEPFYQEDFACKPFWAEMENEGLQVAVVDPVESPMAGLKNGIEVAEWFTHRRAQPPHSSPAPLIDELMQRYGDDPLQGNANIRVRRGLEMDELARVSETRIKTKTKAMLDLLGRRSWDLFSVAYPDGHDMGHLAWHLLDSDAARAPNPVTQAYRHLDSAVARLMETVEPGGTTLLILGPGMEEYVSANHLLPDILLALHGKRRPTAAKLLRRAVRKLMFSRFVSDRLLLRLRDTKRRVGQSARFRDGQRYYAIPHNANSGAVRISLRGRDPSGVVDPGQHYDELCAWLTERLLRLDDATGSRRIVKNVIKLRDHYDGPELNRLPDLLVVWDRDADTSAASSPDIGVVKGESPSVRTGDHSKHGMLISDQPLRTETPNPLAPTQVTSIIQAAVRDHTAQREAASA